MAVLYQGSRYVRHNEFKDKKGNSYVFEKVTKNGKMFLGEAGYVVLSDKQADKLVEAREVK